MISEVRWTGEITYRIIGVNCDRLSDITRQTFRQDAFNTAFLGTLCECKEGSTKRKISPTTNRMENRQEQSQVEKNTARCKQAHFSSIFVIFTNFTRFNENDDALNHQTLHHIQLALCKKWENPGCINVFKSVNVKEIRNEEGFNYPLWAIVEKQIYVAEIYSTRQGLRICNLNAIYNFNKEVDISKFRNTFYFGNPLLIFILFASWCMSSNVSRAAFCWSAHIYIYINIYIYIHIYIYICVYV